MPKNLAWTQQQWYILCNPHHQVAVYSPTERVFVYVDRAQELIPKNRFRPAGTRFLGSLEGEEGGGGGAEIKKMVL
jgi:hypothetical protein